MSLFLADALKAERTINLLTHMSAGRANQILAGVSKKHEPELFELMTAVYEHAVAREKLAQVIIKVDRFVA